MAKKELLFEDLIELLKVIHTPEDIQKNLFDELINATLAVGLTAIQQSAPCTEKEALDVLQHIVNEHIEAIKKEQ